MNDFNATSQDEPVEEAISVIPELIDSDPTGTVASESINSGITEMAS